MYSLLYVADLQCVACYTLQICVWLSQPPTTPCGAAAFHDHVWLTIVGCDACVVAAGPRMYAHVGWYIVARRRYHTRAVSVLCEPLCQLVLRRLGNSACVSARALGVSRRRGVMEMAISPRFTSLYLSLSPPMSSHPSTSVESSSDRFASYLTSLHIITITLSTSSHHGYRSIGITLPASSHHHHHHHHVITITSLPIIIITRGCELGSRCGFVYSWCGPSARAGLVT